MPRATKKKPAKPKMCRFKLEPEYITLIKQVGGRYRHANGSAPNLTDALRLLLLEVGKSQGLLDSPKAKLCTVAIADAFGDRLGPRDEAGRINRGKAA